MKSKYRERFPSEEFGNHIGLNLHKNWKLPKGHTPEKIAKLLQKGTAIDIMSFYWQLVTLNPILANITGDIYDICYGAMSKFQYCDLKFFCEKGNKVIDYNVKARPRTMAILKNCGKYPEFVMCPKTLLAVEKHLKIKS